MPKISVIVPVYNCEKYISKCIESILNQTFKDLELILVDDGSSDKSYEICSSFSQDSRVKLVRQENGGVSKARNLGIEMSKGDFITFVDSDDYLVLNMYEQLYKNLIESGADISICGIMNCFIKKDKTVETVRQSDIDGIWVFSGEKAMEESFKSKLFSVNPVNKLFKRELFKSLRYPEGKISEDAFLIPTVLSRACKVVYDSSPMYYYVRRENSITTSDFSFKDWSVVEAYKYHFDVVRKKFPNVKKAAEFRYLWSYTYVMDRIMISNSKVSEEDFRKAYDFIKNNSFKIFLNPYFSIKRKIATMILLISKKGYKKLIMKMDKR